jgi:adenylate cyclase
MHRAARQPLFWLVILAASAVAGLVYNRIIGGGEPTVAAVRGILMAAPLLAFESGWILPGWQQYVRRLPTLLAVPAAEATYIVLIASGFAASGLLLWGVGGLSGPWLEAVTPSLRVLLYALLVSAAIVSVIRIRDLIGSEVFFSLLVGRYHRPVREERVFLFIDIVGSTRYAEAHGDLRAQEFLGAFFAALAEPVRRHEGSVDDYSATWPSSPGRSGAASRTLNASGACSPSRTRLLGPLAPGASVSAQSRASGLRSMPARWSPRRSGSTGTRSRISATR